MGTPEKPSGGQKSLSVLFDVPVTTVVSFTPSPAGSRKAQQTLEAVLGLPGPQVALPRSPEWFTRSAKKASEEVQRAALTAEMQPREPGSIVAVPVHRPHTGGSKGGRPVRGQRTGQAAGLKSNQRPLGAPVLRRDPTAQERLAVIRAIEAEGQNPSTQSAVGPDGDWRNSSLSVGKSWPSGSTRKQSTSVLSADTS